MTRGVPGSRQPHGTTARGKFCGCPACMKAKAVYQQRRTLHNHSRLPATGTRRRLQALAALGWPSAEIAARLGVSDAAVIARTSSSRTVDRTNAARIRRVYDELSMTVGPSSITRKRALAKGWVPPLAWDDDSIDDPSAEPQGVGYMRTPVADTIRELQDLGLDLNQIADRLRVTKNAVELALSRARRAA